MNAHRDPLTTRELVIASLACLIAAALFLALAARADAQSYGCWADGICTPRTNAEIRLSGCVICTVGVPPPALRAEDLARSARPIALVALPTPTPAPCPWPPTLAKCCPGFGTLRFPRTAICPPPPGPTKPPVPTPQPTPPPPPPTAVPTPSSGGPFRVSLENGTWFVNVPYGAVARLVDSDGTPITSCERLCALLHLSPCAATVAPSALFVASHTQRRIP